MRSVFALALIFAGVASAHADEVLFSEMASEAREKDAVMSVLGKSADGAKIHTTVKDLDGDRKAEIFVRVVGPKQCGAELKVCPTRILTWRGDAWQTVFSRSVGRLDLEGIGFGGVSGILADETKWSWTGKRYKLDVADSGKPIELKPAPANFAKPLIAQFGAGASKLAAKDPKVQVSIAAAQLQPGKTEVVVARLEGPGVCGAQFGCPWRVVRVKSGSYETLLEGTGDGAIAVMNSERQGWRDVTTELPEGGYATYGWSGSRYGLAEFNEGSRR